MSIMISPRSQENQYHYQQQQAPNTTAASAQSNQTSSIPSSSNLPNPQANYPLFGNNNWPGIATNLSTPTSNGVSIGGGSSNGQAQPTSTGAGSTAGFNLTYNNNYTTTNPLPPSSNSSFSLPSVPQAVYYDQQAQQQQPQQAPTSIPPPIQGAPIGAPIQGGAPGEAGQAHQQPVYYYQQQFFQPPPTAGAPLIAPTSNGSVANGSGPDFNQYQQLQFAPAEHQIPPPHSQVQIQGNGVLPIPVNSNEEIPFPGVLDPNAYQQQAHVRSQSTSSNPPNYHPRSNTYPTIDNKPMNAKHNRQSLTSSSLLGMTPETARRNRCQICQKQFKRPSSLQTHSYSHTGEKPFACSWENCGRLFSVRSNMIRHRKLHERDDKLKKGSISSASSGLEDDEESNKENGTQQQQQQQNANGNGSTGLPNLLHPHNGHGHSNGDFQLGYFN